MTKINHCPPLAGPGSDPVLYGVAQALADLFPPMDNVQGGADTPETQMDIDPPKTEIDEVTVS